jgi:hypothetical protein
MAEARPIPRANGFSLVEMMVALVFTLVLMAGMATVFKASLSTFYTSGEMLSSARRNWMSTDLLGDDINTACMYLGNPYSGPLTYSNNPPFYILPNVTITGAPGVLGPGDPVTADELYFILDQALPFTGTFAGPGAAQSANQQVMNATGNTLADRTFTINCNSLSYANMVQQGQVFIFMDQWEQESISAMPIVNADNSVTVVTAPVTNSAGENLAGITGTGVTGLSSKALHINGSGIMVMLPTQMIRYRMQWLQLDPTNPNGVPCLVRDQGNYTNGAFVANQAQQIITENVAGFKVYLSTNSGQTWAGLGLAPGNPAPGPGGGFSAGWDQGIRTQLDTQLGQGVGAVAASGRPGYQSTRVSTMGDNWFRYIPTLVRIDVTTRTAAQRTEYSTTANTAAYKQLTQSLVFVPRHSGLPLGM